MKYKNKIISGFLLTTVALFAVACAKQTAESGNVASNNANAAITNSNRAPVQTVVAKSPSEAYKLLFAAVKAKDSETIKQLMSKSSLGFAEFNANNQKITLEKSLENGLVAPVLSPTLTEIRDERIKDNFGAIEVYNAQTKSFEDLPFVLEDGSWKVAVGDIFQDTYKSPGKGRAQIERDSSNKSVPLSSNSMSKMPDIPKGEQSIQVPPSVVNANKTAVQAPKDDKPKK
jgi:hypothetical protein